MDTKTVGRGLAHDSAPLHVQGSATYVDDLREPEGLVHVYPGYARDGAHGTIKSIDLDAVLRAPGEEVAGGSVNGLVAFTSAGGNVRSRVSFTSAGGSF